VIGTAHLRRLERLIVDDSKFLSTILSYVLTVAIYANLSTIRSAIVGIAFCIAYLFINGVFLADAFFKKEALLFRLIFGLLLVIMLLGFVGYIVMVIYNLDLIETTFVLFTVSTISSLVNKRMKPKNVL